jgi:peptidyl-prolyl cis-trans isomerase A (cyclophilin A)
VAKKKKKASGASQSSASTTASRPTPPSNDTRILAIGAALVGAAALFAWMGSGSSREPAEHPSHRSALHEPPEGGPIDPRLLHPERLTEHAPDTYAVELDTTAGDIVIDVTRAWSPNGADRFYNLVRAGFYTDVAFFRVIDGFMAQTGISGRPPIASAWADATIPDDPVVQHNTRGYVSFATAGPNTRTTQFFINFADNSRLDATGFSPFGHVRDMRVVDELEDRYGEGPPMGIGPEQGRITNEGNAYLREHFGDLDYIESARIL